MTVSLTHGISIIALATLALVCAAPLRAADAVPSHFIVEAGKTDRVDTPVSVVLNKLPDDVEHLDLYEIKTSTAPEHAPVEFVLTPHQVDTRSPKRLCWVLSGKTPAGTTRQYVWAALYLNPGETGKSVTVTQDAAALDIAIGETKVLRYNHAVVPAPKGVDPIYKRSGFIHPLWAPDGQVLTQIHPKDHYHHFGLWNPWTNTKFEGKKTDFWNLKAGQGTVRFAKFLSTASGPVFGRFTALQEHVALKAAGGPKVALNDAFSVTAWKLNDKPDGFLLDFVSTQRCASDSPLELAKYRYGGFGFRGNAEWGADNSNYLSSEGKTRKDGHATRSRWCIIHGKTKKGPAGIIIMSHPLNHAHPEPMRIWDKQPMIFFNYCPIQTAAWTLKPGQDYVFRYRAYAFKGTVTAADAERLWQDFANPPKVAPADAKAQAELKAALERLAEQKGRIASSRLEEIEKAMKAYEETKAREATDKIIKYPFFILNNGTGRGKLPPAEQAKLLKDFGCDGLSYSSTTGVKELLAALDAQGVKMFANYLSVNVGANKPKYDPALPAAITAMAGRDTFVWLYVVGAKAGDKAAEARAVEVVREVADLAAKAKLRVALYPHTGFFVERFDHALALAKKVGRDNVGVTFNLCHFLQVQGKDDITAALKKAGDRLFLVSINGADVGGTGWKALIQTLDKGTFDNGKLLKTLRELNYRGPIGLQCYGIGGDLRQNLKNSMAAWKKLNAVATPDKKGS